jgi:hypothetical protein
MLALIAAPFVANADAAVATQCDSSRVAGTLPVANAVDVPVDAALVFLMDGDCGVPWHLAVVAADSPDVVLASERLQVTDSVGVLVPADVLAENTDYELRAGPDNASPYAVDEVIVPFRTGSGLVRPLSGDLHAEITDVTRFLDTGRIDAIVTVEPAEDLDGLSWVQLVDPFTEDAFPAAGTAGHGFNSSLGGEPTADWCVDVAQFDGHGTAYGDPIHLCATPTLVDHDPQAFRGACATVPGGGPLSGLIVALLFATRRRCSR